MLFGADLGRAGKLDRDSWRPLAPAAVWRDNREVRALRA